MLLVDQHAIELFDPTLHWRENNPFTNLGVGGASSSIRHPNLQVSFQVSYAIEPLQPTAAGHEMLLFASRLATC